MSKQHRFTSPDGRVHTLTTPDDVSSEQAFTVLQQQLGSQEQSEQFAGRIQGGGLLSDIAAAVKGRQDPANQDLPTVYDQFAEGHGFTASRHGQYDLTSPVATAAMGGANDAVMADVMQQHLGDRFLRREQDANGNPILVTQGEAGQEQRGYVNQPGLDVQDAWRALYGAAPYVAGGGVAGTAMRGLAGKLATYGIKPAAQAITAAATSLGGDLSNASLGSQQGLDEEKLVMSTLGGAGGEVIAPAGSVLLRGIRGPAGNLTPDGVLTDSAKEIAKRVGLNFDDLSKAEQQQFATGLNKGSDPREIASLIQTNRFGIQTTKATRTQDPELSAVEKDIRAGTHGQDAKQHMQEFDQAQREQIEQSALSKPYSDEATTFSRVQGEPGDPYKDGMGAFLAPTRTATTADARRVHQGQPARHA